MYGLKFLPQHLRRLRHLRGHGVHSPYVYNIVRKVFMQRKLVSATTDLYEALRALDIAERRCVELQNLVAHCGYDSWAVDNTERRSFIVCSLATTYDQLERYARYAHRCGATLCVISPYHNAQRLEVCRNIVKHHGSTTIDNRAYLLVFNNHLPKQVFEL